MGDISWPLEIVAHILSYVDGETLLAFEQASPNCASVMMYLAKSGIWKKCCYKEIPRRILFQLVSKLNPHKTDFTCDIDWKKLCRSWYMIQRMKNHIQWQIVTFRCSNNLSAILDITSHGPLILLFLKLTKTYGNYYKVVTLNKSIKVLHKSWLTGTNTMYITSIGDSNVAPGDIPLYCNECKLVGISVSSPTTSRVYPKVVQDHNLITAEHSNGDVFTFYDRRGLLSASNCTGAEVSFCSYEEAPFIELMHDPFQIYISCGSAFLELETSECLQGSVTCTTACAGFMLVGTDAGILYIYYCTNETEVLQLDLRHFTWKFCPAWQPIIAADVVILEDTITFVCCTEINAFKISPI